MKKTLQQVHTQINIHTYTNKDTHKNIETHKRKSHMVAAKLDFEEERKYVEILLPKTLNLVEEFLNPSLGNSVLFTVEGEHNDIHCTMEEVNDTFFPPQSWLCSLGDRGCLLGEDMVEKLQLPNLKKKKTLGLSWTWKDSVYIDFFLLVSLRKTNYILVSLRKFNYVSQHGS